MNLSDLLHSEVVDADGVRLGSVDDVRVVQDGPLLLPFGAAFRVEGLMIGHRSVGTRLGFTRGGLRGPWLLRAIFAAFERRAKYVPWDAVASWDGEVVRVTKRREELGSIEPSERR
jgi:hypothetical protein